jgi:hypothetical protein
MVRFDTVTGVIPVDDFGDDEVSVPIDMPPLCEEAIVYIARVQEEARRAVAEAEHRTTERIAQYLEGQSVNLHPSLAAIKVRSLEWHR